MVVVFFGFPHRAPDAPHDQRKGKGQQDAEKRAGGGDDNLVDRFEPGEFLAREFALALEIGIHQLRQFDEAAEGDAAEAVGDAIDLLLPQRFAEPDAKALHDRAAPAGGEEMAPFMHDDEEVEDHQHFQNDADEFENAENLIHDAGRDV
ncbi:MAG: hypothetical protein WDN28_14650 [Chthoniobacter sp.]